MAENKKSFLLYTDIIHTVEKLPDEKAGILFKHILQFVNDKNPVIDDFIIEIAFEPIKQSLKRDLEKYEKICNRNAINGAKGGRPVEEKPKKPSGLIGNPKNPTKPKKADSDIDNDIDNDIDSGIDSGIESKEEIIIDEIYNLYPAKCFVQNRSTGKCSKDKNRIKALLKKHSHEHITAVIKQYLKESKETNTYIKNFATFLNNLPELKVQSNKEKYREQLFDANGNEYSTDTKFDNLYKIYKSSKDDNEKQLIKSHLMQLGEHVRTFSTLEKYEELKNNESINL